MYMYYRVLQMKKSTFKKMFCKMYIVSSYSNAYSIFMAYFHTLPAKIHTWRTGSVIVDM